MIPANNYLATYEANLPKRWPLPSTITCLVNIMELK